MNRLRGSGSERGAVGCGMPGGVPGCGTAIDAGGVVAEDLEHELVGLPRAVVIAELRGSKA